MTSSDDGRQVVNASLAVFEGPLGLGIEQTNAVMVLQAHGLCDQDLDILNGGVGRELDLGRELLDGLLGGYT